MCSSVPYRSYSRHLRVSIFSLLVLALLLFFFRMAFILSICWFATQCWFFYVSYDRFHSRWWEIRGRQQSGDACREWWMMRSRLRYTKWTAFKWFFCPNTVCMYFWINQTFQCPFCFIETIRRVDFFLACYLNVFTDTFHTTMSALNAWKEWLRAFILHNLTLGFRLIYFFT